MGGALTGAGLSPILVPLINMTAEEGAITFWENIFRLSPFFTAFGLIAGLVCWQCLRRISPMHVSISEEKRGKDE